MEGIRWLVSTVRSMGPREMLRKLYHYDYIKTGTLVGVDRLGNRYYEDLSEQHGRHRYVEYNTDLGHNDPSRVQPEWHGWLHHMTDNTPFSPSEKRGLVNSSVGTHVPFPSEHQGGESAEHRINPGLVVPRGYKVGSIYADVEGMDSRYKQPGNPLSDKYTQNSQKMHSWDPNDPGARVNEPRERARSLDLE